ARRWARAGRPSRSRSPRVRPAAGRPQPRSGGRTGTWSERAGSARWARRRRLPLRRRDESVQRLVAMDERRDRDLLVATVSEARLTRPEVDGVDPAGGEI